jgi:hypothetical protein
MGYILLVIEIFINIFIVMKGKRGCLLSHHVTYVLYYFSEVFSAVLPQYKHLCLMYASSSVVSVLEVSFFSCILCFTQFSKLC